MVDRKKLYNLLGITSFVGYTCCSLILLYGVVISAKCAIEDGREHRSRNAHLRETQEKQHIEWMARMQQRYEEGKRSPPSFIFR